MFRCNLPPALFQNDRDLLRAIAIEQGKMDFAWVTDEADRSVVLALLQVAFLGKCDD